MASQFLPLLLIAVLALLLIMNSRRQKRVIAQARALQSSLVPGDRVVTTCGLHATVVGSAEEETIDLEISPGVRTTWLRAAIRERVTLGAVGTEEADALEAPAAESGARADKS